MDHRIVFALLALALPLSASHAAVDPSARQAAATKVANESHECKDIRPFYWEIGDARGMLASGSPGGDVTRTTIFPIASASKWFFGAYVLEKTGGKIDDETRKALTMQAGYTSEGPMTCVGAKTVMDCEHRASNSQFNAQDEGHFFYNGGHFQKWAVDHGMGPLNRLQLAKTYHEALGGDLPFTFAAANLAGGMRTSAEGYALFLQKILAGKLKMKEFLGASAVCTLPSACPQAHSSPVPWAWHYGYAHWIEDDPKEGDGSFSSAGLFGFYPWIEKTKTYYGVIARQKMSRGGKNGAAQKSYACGRLIRKAYLSER